MKLEKYTVYQRLLGHNMYTSTEISAAAAGITVVARPLKLFTSGCSQNSPRGYDIDWAGISADEVAQATRIENCAQRHRQLLVTGITG
jgi:HAE1 family hydrophobic/amphiphilic exporter-1